MIFFKTQLSFVSRDLLPNLYTAFGGLHSGLMAIIVIVFHLDIIGTVRMSETINGSSSVSQSPCMLLGNRTTFNVTANKVMSWGSADCGGVGKVVFLVSLITSCCISCVSCINRSNRRSLKTKHIVICDNRIEYRI